MSKTSEEFSNKLAGWMQYNVNLFLDGKLTKEVLITQNNSLLDVLKTFGGGDLYLNDPKTKKVVDDYFKFANTTSL